MKIKYPKTVMNEANAFARFCRSELELWDFPITEFKISKGVKGHKGTAGHGTSNSEGFITSAKVMVKPNRSDNFSDYLETIAHEFGHVHQYKTGRLKELFVEGRKSPITYWDGVKHVFYTPSANFEKYFNSPWEVNAREIASDLVKLWIELERPTGHYCGNPLEKPSRPITRPLPRSKREFDFGQKGTKPNKVKFENESTVNRKEIKMTENTNTNTNRTELKGRDAIIFKAFIELNGMEKWVAKNAIFTRANEAGAGIAKESTISQVMGNLKRLGLIESEMNGKRSTGRFKVAKGITADMLPTVKGASEDAQPIGDTRTIDEIKDSLNSKFKRIVRFADKLLKGVANCLIVSGNAGMGKTHIIEQIMREKGFELGKDYSYLKGKATGFMFYSELINMKGKGQIIICDDTDSLLNDSDSLNLLKAATESKRIRTVSWNTKAVVDAGLATSFEYEGTIIFLSNHDYKELSEGTSALATDLNAIKDRSLFVNIGCYTEKEALARIQQVVESSDILSKYGLTDKQAQEIMDGIMANKDRLHLSLRTVDEAARVHYEGGENPDWIDDLIESKGKGV